MTQDNLPVVRGSPGGSRGATGAPGGSRLPLAPKRVINSKIMLPNHGLKYPKCVPTQKGLYLLISEAFGAIWMLHNSDI